VNWSDYSPEQEAAIRSEAARTLVLSGAGSGKTRVVAGRVQWLLECGLQPSRVCVCTFTTAAAKVLSGRVGAKLGHCGTLHSLLLRLLNKRAEKVGFAPGIGVLDAAQSAALLGQTCRQHRYKGTAAELGEAVKGTGGGEAARLVVAAYRRSLKDNNALDYDGILDYGRQLATFCRADDWPFDFLVVDEYQDTSSRQADAYEAMPVGRRFYVGDANQSIFSFLGGDVRNILGQAAAGAQVFRLDTNYRCSVAVCQAAQRLLDAGGLEGRVVHRAGAPAGSVEVAEYPDEEAEALGVVRKVRELEAERCSALLVRTNAERERWEKALEGYGVPVARAKKQEQPPDWAAVRALLAALNSPGNDLVAEAYLAAVKGPEVAAAARREAASRMTSLNDLSLKLPQAETAAEALALVQARQPSQASAEKLAAAASLLGDGATCGDLLLALAEPQAAEQEASGVVVSTVHGFKGREAMYIFLPGFEEGSFPCGRDMATPESEAECRRLAYVAATRAEVSLFASWCRTRKEKWWRGRPAQREPSRFLAEMGIALQTAA
jgi:DNA helicase-2/ATP-dependent DNA helicase PcrA